MNESIGGAVLYNIIFIVLGSLIAVFTATFAYSKAFKAKNIIIDTIQEYNNENMTHSIVYGNEILYEDDDVIEAIDNQLSNIGYSQRKIECKSRHDGQLIYPSTPYSGASTSMYYRKNKGYCIYKIKQTNSNGSESYYYEVQTNLFFDIPLFNLNIPIYGQTKSYQPNPKNILEEEFEDDND